MSQTSFDLAKLGLEWGYDGECDPLNWSAKYPKASGNNQSPINIKTSEAVYDLNLTESPLTFSYDPECFRTILNTGSSFKISGDSKTHSSVIGGPVTEEHEFLQFHMHWGKNESEGSEHLIDGKSYAGEIHFVNWNSKRYAQASEAASSNSHDGLTVLGVLVQVGEHNTEFDKILNCLDEIKLRDQNTNLKENLDVKNLFPNDTTSYWTYQGSLTTPPCTESVRWIVYKDAIDISLDQLNKLRDLYQCKEETDCCDHHRINHNYRPICEINNRVVSKSFN